ncbi:MAG TPA: tetratricopeptide repeat protein [Thermoanaerobaculia bacterium]|jgi:predicted negative regulator of RcsB-dependent stress response|nr:tetratricopeptide repeat protein [Thermoanaerobaculia bacterium]
MSKRPTTSAKVIPNVPLQRWDIESCGAGSLSTVLQHYGDPTTMDAWDRALPKTRGGVLSIDLVLAARQKGFDAHLVTGSRATVERELLDGRPVILMLQVIQAPGKGYDFFHYVVLDGIDTGARLVRVQFGDRKARWVKFDRFENAWKGGGHAQIVIAPKDPSADALRAAVILEEQGNYGDAADAYRRIITDHPDSLVAWTNLGNAEMQLGHHAKAEEAFRKALTLDATSADALNNLAWLLYQQKRLDEAEQLAHRAVAAPAPDEWMRLDTLAQIQLARGACADALSSWERALKGVPATRVKERDDMARAMSDARERCRS